MDPTNPDDQIRLVHEQVKQAQERAKKAAQMAREVEAVRESAASAKREVTVEVDSAGRVQNITFTESAFDLEPAQLSAVVLETLNKAKTKAGQRVMRLAESAYAGDTALIGKLRETYFPGTAEEDKAKGAGGLLLNG